MVINDATKRIIDEALKKYDFLEELCSLCRDAKHCEWFCHGNSFDPKLCNSLNCTNRGKECHHCKYALPRFQNFYELYKPTCPLFNDCIYDPAYIQKIHPQYYKELYGELTPKEAFQKYCVHHLENNGCPYYDDEDK